MHTQSLTALKNKLLRKEISSVELTHHFLSRIEKYNPELNAFITLTKEHALKQAALADKAIAQGQAQALTGLPVAHKDIFCTHHIKTTCASKMLADFIPPYESTITDRMQTAGAIMLGKTNMDEFAMGSSNENSSYGPVKNPWDVTCIPGGSSGGSAACIAARLAAAATGTDTGGSIRQPAALCGITGLKPTYGRVSRWGMIAFASSFDQGGPMTQTVEDAALILSVIAGHDPKDSTSIDHPVDDYLGALQQPIQGMTVGLPKEYFSDALDPSTAQALQACIETYKQQGVQFKEISLPHTDLATAAYYVLAPAECSSNLARFDGVRYGHRCDAPKDLADLYERSRSEGLGDEVQRRILVGTYVLSSGYYDAYYKKAQKIRRLIRDDFLKAFETVDAILTPTTPSPAFKLGAKTADPVQMYLSDIYTIAVNLAGLPALSMPMGFATGLPLGAQIIGKHFAESTLLTLGHHFQTHTNYHQCIPDAFVD